MPRVSINEMTTFHWSFDEDVTNLRAFGIDGIGAWRRKLTEFGEERGIELVRDSGITVTSLSMAGGFTGSDGQTFREAVDDALEALKLAAEIEAGCLVVITGARCGHTLNHARRLVREALVELGDAGAELGVEIALQPMRPQPIERWTFLTSLDMTLELLTSCDHPQVGFVFDVYHLCREIGLEARIAEIAPWIKIAALCDARLPAKSDDDRCLPGKGMLPLRELVRRLEEGGFRGWYDVQILCEESWKADYGQLIADCRVGLEAICPELFSPRSKSTAPAAENVAPLPVAVEPQPPE
ncbi:MAG TPA: sugar phosphate isomerase/epimerase family protein [Planctomycetaceae bacterium]|nr:sugar phosphate isomerase/epimerase family protein [Planctomycetaceae bacterium]